MWGSRNESGKSYINFLFRLQEILLLLVMLASANIFSSPEVYCIWFIKMKHHVRENFILKEGGRVERSFWLIFLAEGLVCRLCGLNPASRVSPPTVSGGKRSGRALPPSAKGSSVLLVVSRVVGGTSELTQAFSVSVLFSHILLINAETLHHSAHWMYTLLKLCDPTWPGMVTGERANSNACDAGDGGSSSQGSLRWEDTPALPVGRDIPLAPRCVNLVYRVTVFS